MNCFLRQVFFCCIVKPIIFLLLGVSTHHRERLPKKGPAILVANHNSHLDTLVLMSLFPIAQLPKVRPVAAADYFLTNKWVAWFATKIIGIIPIQRAKVDRHPFAAIDDLLVREGIVIFFPEGTRGDPEHLSKLKTGIAHIAADHPEVPIIPIFLYGAGKSLPKGEALLVPFVVDVQVGEPIFYGSKERVSFMAELERFFISFAH